VESSRRHPDSRRARSRRSFRPPHCPNRACPFYTPTRRWPYRREGFYARASSPAPVQRFRCTHCGRKFSATTFSVSYYLKRPQLLPKVADLSVHGAGLRQIGRALAIPHATVALHLARAGRHCLLFHRRLLRSLPLTEPLVVDGFETFEFSQYFPFHLNLAAGAHSWFLYHFTDSPLRRKGRMRPAQKRRRAELEATLGRPDPKAVETGIVELLLPLLPLVPTPPAPPCLVVHSDDHPAYPRALRRLHALSACPQIDHRITSSLVRRTQSNPLFPVNLADLLLRHCSANHRRETIAFSKRRQAALERLAVFTVWRNCIKWKREQKRGETAAMELGLLDRRWAWREVFRRRLFPRREELPDPWWSYYWRQVKTPALEKQTDHALGYAF